MHLYWKLLFFFLFTHLCLHSWRTWGMRKCCCDGCLLAHLCTMATERWTTLWSHGIVCVCCRQQRNILFIVNTHWIVTVSFFSEEGSVQCAGKVGERNIKFIMILTLTCWFRSFSCKLRNMVRKRLFHRALAAGRYYYHRCRRQRLRCC